MNQVGVAGLGRPLSRSEARAALDAGRELRRVAAEALALPTDAEHVARAAYEVAREEVLVRQLSEMPIARLRDTTQGSVRFAAIERAGYRTVGSVLDVAPYRLTHIQGVGDHSAHQVVGAARQLRLAMQEGLRIRFEVDRKPEEQAQLLSALATFAVVQTELLPLSDRLVSLHHSIDTLERDAKRGASGVRMFFSGHAKKERARAALATLVDAVANEKTLALVERASVGLERSRRPQAASWSDYERNVARYNGALVVVGGLAPDRDAEEGFISSELAERIHEHPLDTSLLGVSLRGYQAFGAKFALQQGRAMLGDEMGLGKTIEALAAMCHLQSEGATHFLVVCPASVLINWMHEIERHSDLASVRLHGSERGRNASLWARRGGVGVTTFQTLSWLGDAVDESVVPALLVVDEAHYVKSPKAQRTMHTLDWIETSERTLFMTGTPMENRVDEFKTLIQHLQPAVARSVSALDGLAGATSFRRAVASVYLRRNQDDVLQELPPRIEVEDWLDFEGADLAAYREAVADGHFMRMRQAAFVPGTRAGSGKLARLLEIVEEATSNDRKVVIFSFFRSVLDVVHRELADLSIGQLTGSVSPPKRQQLIDRFTETNRACALVSQIEAGGVGLNIQTASVVILTEPQWKPSTEDQAIARCHRMGQARPVNVHRLLAENTVDRRMLEILSAKASLFAEYVRRSELKDVSPDAVDVSDLNVTKTVASFAEEERRIIEAEQRRLGLPITLDAADAN